MELFLISVWFIRTVGNLCQATYYWQLKEYRWDRMREFLVQQRGHVHFLNSFHILLLVCLVVFFCLLLFLTVTDVMVDWFAAVVSVLFLAEALEFIHRLWIRKFKRPRLTIKALLIMTLDFLWKVAVLAVLLLILGWPMQLEVLVITLAALAFLDHDMNALVVGVVNLVTNTIKNRRYQAARLKRLTRKDLRVVGITGSYGKTSVKEYITHLLEGEFDVLKTAKNTNTEIGIAHTILKELKPHHQVFVCEMGAYNVGEIKLCCLMARPQIGVFTGLNEQHIALFGSLNKTFQAKWELMTSLPADGVAVFNGDSDNLRERLQPFRGRSLVCSTSEGEFRAESIDVKSDSIAFTYDGQRFKAPLIGEFQVINVLMSIVVAEQFGLSMKEIAERVATLEAPEKTMELVPVPTGYLLDDSYNVNPDGLRAALQHMELFPEYRKIIFFPGILELGDKSKTIHRDLGEAIGHHVDYAFFTDPNFSGQLVRGALQGGLTRRHIYEGADTAEMMVHLARIFESEQNKPSIILFESRGSEAVMEWLKNLDRDE